MLLFDPTQPGFRGKYLLILDWSGFSKDPKSQPQQIHHIQEVIVSILTYFFMWYMQRKWWKRCHIMGS